MRSQSMNCNNGVRFMSAFFLSGWLPGLITVQCFQYKVKYQGNWELSHVYSLKYGGFSLLLYYNFDNFLKSMEMPSF